MLETAVDAGIYIAIGSNIRPEENIPRAIEALGRHGRVTGLSDFYETEAIGRPEQPRYLNGAAALQCDAPAHELKFGILRAIEAALGRERGGDPHAPRTIDLDIALYGAAVLDLPGLRIPDPDIRTRPFLAAALLDLDPALRMPDTAEPVAKFADAAARRTLQPARAFTAMLKERFLA